MNANQALEKTVKSLFGKSFNALFHKIENKCVNGETHLVIDSEDDFYQEWMSTFSDDTMNVLIRYLKSLHYSTDAFYGTYTYPDDAVDVPTTDESRNILIIKW